MASKPNNPDQPSRYQDDLIKVKLTAVPVVVTRNAFLFPGFASQLEIGRPDSLQSIKLAKDQFDNHVVLISQINPEQDDPKPAEIYRVGTWTKFDIKKEWDNGTLSINFRALDRAEITRLWRDPEKNCYLADINIFTVKPTLDEQKLIEEISNEIESLVTNSDKEIPNAVFNQLTQDMRAGEILNTLGQFLPFLSAKTRQALLEEVDLERQLAIIMAEINMKQQNNEIEQTLTKKIKGHIDQQQREFYLREKLRTIKEELGEMGTEDNEIKNYLKRLETEPFPEAIKTRVKDEIKRYEAMPQASSEANILRTYIDWMMELPWYQKTKDINDLDQAQVTLDKNHYGLKKVKERIIENLAARIMSKNNKGQIICLVGPAGVGKTSLARSIAAATGRNFVKVALGGVRDEAEIRGHRRTYIGAMPGRIIQAMKKAKSINPVFLIDEIDKLASDYRGDPASALLEVLDPEQNTEFSDHYIEENYDLSNVLFIATANYYEDIPVPLLDRMETIFLSSYTEIEKLEIAQRHLVPRVLTQNGLNQKQLRFTKNSITELIKYYTREAGVRQLERLLSQITRKFIVKYLRNEIKTDTITPEKVRDYLGKRQFEYTKKSKKSEVGVATGLAYTQYGGDILAIEVNYFKGRGRLILTGKLGEVMKESASIALDYLKANATKYHLNLKKFDDIDIHIHVPEGAVPKDGPSAGITITTAILSALTKKPISKNIGMTGEITLRGEVLPIGGLKEKSISAHRSGLKTILIPYDNLKDLDEIPDEVKKGLEIIPVKTYQEVFNQIFTSHHHQESKSPSTPAPVPSPAPEPAPTQA